jgi:peptidyl-prolyl cis-trans isomerase C
MKAVALAAILSLAPLAWAQGTAPAAIPLITNGPIEVTSEDFEAFLLRAPEDVRPEIRMSPERISKSVETVYTNRVLAEEARKAGLDKDPRVQLRMRQIVEGYLAQLWMSHYPKSIAAPDFAVRAQEVYRLDRARFTEPERISATHLVVGFNGRTREMALERAKEAAVRARADENFAALAKIYTDDPNFKNTGGRLEAVAARDLEKPIAEAAFAAPAGSIVGPVETPSGFHVLRIEQKVPSRLRPLDEVKDALVAAEREKFANLSTDRRIGELKNTPQTKVYDENILKLVAPVPREQIDRLHRDAAGLPTR